MPWLSFGPDADRELLQNIRSDVQLMLSRRLDESPNGGGSGANAAAGAATGTGGGASSNTNINVPPDGIERVLFSNSGRHAAPPKRWVVCAEGGG